MVKDIQQEEITWIHIFRLGNVNAWCVGLRYRSLILSVKDRTILLQHAGRLTFFQVFLWTCQRRPLKKKEPA
jgi:hypothetical protein